MTVTIYGIKNCDTMKKARAAGDGTFYVPLDRWPMDTERLELRKPWVVLP